MKRLFLFILSVCASFSIHSFDRPIARKVGISYTTSENPMVRRTSDICRSDMLMHLPLREPQGIGLTFLATTRLSSPFPAVQPPDTMGAVGPTQYIMAVNNGIRSFDKATGIADNVLNVSLTTFFSSSTQAFDPIIRYDDFSGRWFITAINRGNPNQILIAVSSSSTITPATTWNIYRLVQDTISPAGDTGCFADFDATGIDAHALYIPVIMECSGNPELRHTLFVIQKASIIAGDPVVATAFRDIYVTNSETEIRRGSLRGVDNFDPNPTYGYIIGEVPSQQNPYNELQVFRINNPGSANPTLGPPVPFTVSPFGITLNAPHLGAINANTWLNVGIGPTGLVSNQALRDRILTAHIRNNQLYASHMIAVDQTGSSNNDPMLNDRDAFRWYQLDVTGGGVENPNTVPLIEQEGTLFDDAVSNPRFYTMPSIMTDDMGNMTLSGSVCSANEYVNAFTTGRRSDDPLSTLRSPIRLLTNATTSYNAFPTQFGSRWGDYSNTSVDPVDGSLWTIQQYTAATNDYGLIVVNLTTPPNVDPVMIDNCENTDVMGILTAEDGVPPYTFNAFNAVNGVVVFNANTGAYTFTPTTDFVGVGSFDYQVVDANGGVSNVAMVTITIKPAPTAQDDAVSTCGNAVLNGSVAPLVTGGIMPYTYAVDMTTTHGVLVLDANTGAYTYTPDGVFSGVDSFTYHATGANGCDSNIATVTIEVFEVPIATNGSLLTACENTQLSGSVAGLVSGGTPPYTYAVDVTTMNGTLNLNGMTGAFTYDPDMDYVGPDSFTYHIVDANGCESNMAVISIEVNETATALDDTLDVCRNLFISDSLAGLVSGGTPPYTYEVVAGPTNGTLPTFNTMTGTYSYRPNNNYVGPDSFTYRVTDSKGCESNIGTITFDVVIPGLTVTKMANPDPVNAGENITYTITVSNVGPCDIQLVSFVDDVPLNTTFVSFIQDSGVPFVLSSPPVGFTGQVGGSINLLEVGDIATFTLVVKVDPSVADGGIITNTVTATGTTPDVTVMATTMTDVVRFAQLVLTKEAGCSPLIKGNEVSFAITLTNNGPSDVDGIFLNDPKPPTADALFYGFEQFGFPLVSVQGAGSFTATGNLPAGESTYFNVQYADTSANPPAPIVNTVTVTSVSPALGPIVAMAQVDLVPADPNQIGLFMDAPGSVRAGDQIIIFISLQNFAADINDALFEFFIPDGTTVVDIQSTNDGANTSFYIPFNEIPIDGTGQKRVQAIGNPFPGNTATAIFITLKVDDDTPTGLINVSSKVTDPIGEVNYCLFIGVEAPKLEVTKFDVPDPVFAGNQITYTLRISNSGETYQPGVVFVDTLPEETTFLSIMQNSGIPFTLTTPQVGKTGSITGVAQANFPEDGEAEFEIQVLVDPGTPVGTIFNDVIVTGTNPSKSVSFTGPTTVLHSSDLQISKMSDPNVTAGNQLLYTIDIANNGPSNAQDVTLFDILPMSAALRSINQTGALFDLVGLPQDTGPGGNFIAHIDTLEVNETTTVSLVVDVDKNAIPGTMTNNTILTSNDPLITKNTSLDTTILAPTTTLTITKTSAPNPVRAGDELTYTVIVTNTGPTEACDVTFTDTLPANTQLVSVCQSGKEFDITCFSLEDSGGQIMAQADMLAVGESTIFTIKVLVDEQAPAGIITNEAVIASEIPAAMQMVTEDTTVVAQSAMLSISKDGVPNPVTAGNILTYTVTVMNNGPDDAQNVTFTDTLPMEVSFQSVSQSGVLFNIVSIPTGTGTFVAQTDLLPAGASTTFTLTVLVDEGAPTAPITNQASIASEFPSDLAFVAEITQVIQPSISITKFGTPNPVATGENLTYTITITNGSPLAFNGITITDSLPAQTTFISLIQVTGPTVTFATPPVGSSGTITGNLATLPGGETVQFVVLVNVTPTTPAGDVLTNTVTVNAANPEREVSATSTTNVSGLTNLTVTKTASSPVVNPGDPLVYTIVVTNNGPLDATGLIFQDILPDELTFVSIAQVGVPFTISPVVDNVINAAAPTLLAGQSTTFTVSTLVDANAPGTFITNTGTLSSAVPAAAANGSVTVQILGKEVDLQIAKSGMPNPVFAGNILTYTVAVVNNGPDDAVDVTFTDVLPTNVVFQSINQLGTPFVINQMGNIITGTAPALNAGQSTTFTITVLVPTDTLPGTITNTATIESADPVVSKSISVSTQVVGQNLGLNISKTATPEEVHVGDLITYTVTIINGGPGDVVDLNFTDTLPPETSFVSISQSGVPFSLTGVGNTITAYAPLLGLNEFTIFTITAQVTKNVGGLIENNARVQAGDRTAQARATTTVIPVQTVDIFGCCQEPVCAGDYANLLFSVKNVGDEDVSSLDVVIDLDPSVTFQEGFGNNWLFWQGEDLCVHAHIDILRAGSCSDFSLVIAVPVVSKPCLSTTARVNESHTANATVTFECPVVLQKESCLTKALREKCERASMPEQLEIQGVCTPGKQLGMHVITLMVENKGEDSVHDVEATITMPQEFMILDINASDWQVETNAETRCIQVKKDFIDGKESCAIVLQVSDQVHKPISVCIPAVVTPSSSRHNTTIISCILEPVIESCLTKALKKKMNCLNI